MAVFKFARAVATADRRELALEDRHQEVAGATRRLQEAGIDPFGLGANKVEHRVDQVRRCEHLTVVRDALLRSHQPHGLILAAWPDGMR